MASVHAEAASVDPAAFVDAAAVSVETATVVEAAAFVDTGEVSVGYGMKSTSLLAAALLPLCIAMSMAVLSLVTSIGIAVTDVCDSSCTFLAADNCMCDADGSDVAKSSNAVAGAVVDSDVFKSANDVTVGNDDADAAFDVDANADADDEDDDDSEHEASFIEASTAFVVRDVSDTASTARRVTSNKVVATVPDTASVKVPEKVLNPLVGDGVGIGIIISLTADKLELSLLLVSLSLLLFCCSVDCSPLGTAGRTMIVVSVVIPTSTL